jgi:hypothetical protein
VRIGLLAISGWLVAAALTVGISWSAISVVRDSVVTGSPTVSSLPAPNETVSPVPVPTTSRPSPTAATGALAHVTSQGGSVNARCVAGRPRIVNSTPNQGFTPDQDDSGAEVKFRSPTHESEIKLSCTGLTLGHSLEEKARGGGGGGDDDGGDDHGGGRGSNSGRGGGDDD